MSARSALLAACLLAVSSLAQAQEAGSFDEVLALAQDKNIHLKVDKLVTAVSDSTFPWTFEMVYQLVDLGMPEEVCKPAAAKAGMFWDNPKAMSTITEDGRRSAQSQTITVASNPDLVMVFEFFNEVKWGIKAARDQVGALKPKESWEDDNAFWLRKRKHEEALAALARARGSPQPATEKFAECAFSGPGPTPMRRGPRRDLDRRIHAVGWPKPQPATSKSPRLPPTRPCKPH